MLGSGISFYKKKFVNLTLLTFFIPVFFIFVQSPLISLYTGDQARSGLPPLPISLFGVFLAIFSTIRHVSYRYLSFIALFTMFAALSLIVNYHPEMIHSRLILFIQYITPMLAFVIGISQPVRDLEAPVKAVCIFTLTLMFLQLIFCLMNGSSVLLKTVWNVGIYQQIQYVGSTNIMVAITTLWILLCKAKNPVNKLLIFSLLEFLFIYAIANTQITGVLFTFLSLIAFIHYFIVKDIKIGTLSPFLKIVLILVPICASGIIYKNSDNILAAIHFPYLGEHSSQHHRENRIYSEKINLHDISKSPAFAQRAIYWKYYVSESFKDTGSFLFGHPKQPNPINYPSAHNYYLDLLYNFGFLALSSILAMVAYTFKVLWQNRSLINKNRYLWMLCFSVLFFLGVDNMLKTGLKEPYTGILSFYIWGFLFSQIKYLKNIPFTASKESQC